MFRTLLVAAALWASLGAAAQRLAITFDDGLDPVKEPRTAEWYGRMLSTLERERLRVMFFPALQRIGGDSGLAEVGRWSKAGHEIGNHTSRHRNLASARITLAEFIGDVEEGDAALRQFPTWRPMLRFPFLKEGNTLEKRDGIRAWMRAHDYRPAEVSIDASDWYYNEVYLKLPADDEAKRTALRKAYVAHLLDRAAYYDALARKVLGRSPAHVLLLHTNAINAAWLGDVVQAFRAAGWTFVSAHEAFEDPLYREQPDVLPAGESIVWSLAKVRNEPNLRYPAEDSVYEEPRLRELGLIPPARP
jgi:peptidoglycan/xylan/chitin deacetylase (PgdA/CDA1 family)